MVKLRPDKKNNSSLKMVLKLILSAMYYFVVVSDICRKNVGNILLEIEGRHLEKFVPIMYK